MAQSAAASRIPRCRRSNSSTPVQPPATTEGFLSPAPEVPSRPPRSEGMAQPNPPPRSLDFTTASDSPIRRCQSNPLLPRVEFINAGPALRHRGRSSSPPPRSEGTHCRRSNPPLPVESPPPPVEFPNAGPTPHHRGRKEFFTKGKWGKAMMERAMMLVPQEAQKERVMMLVPQKAQKARKAQKALEMRKKAMKEGDLKNTRKAKRWGLGKYAESSESLECISGRFPVDSTQNAKGGRVDLNEFVSGRFPVDSTQGVWDGLSDVIKSYLSKSVVSIALRDGDTILFSCSGIAMEHQGYNYRFLTTAGLVRVMRVMHDTNDDLKIEVRHEGAEVYKGCLSEFDLDRNLAVVDVIGLYDVQFGPFQRALENLSDCEVLVALGRDVSGEIMAKSLSLQLSSERICEDDENFHCKTSKVWEGGPLLFVDHVVGMNHFLTTGGAIFRPFSIIFKHLQELNWIGAKPLGVKSITYPHTVQGHYYFKELSVLDTKGYPKLPPTMLDDGMFLANTFEETFGDTYDKGVWKKFNNGASNIRQNIVALASFTGEQRFFACTGFFVEGISPFILTSASLFRRNPNDDDEIVENVENFKIQVLLPNDQLTEGTIEHYNLHYNVALVSVKDYFGHRPLVPSLDFHSEVAAVGRCFESGALQTTCGHQVNWTGTLDCMILTRSTCKITKAGIGGPLVSLHGDVVGMNFYDRRIGTPFLAWDKILKILAIFKKSELGEVGNVGVRPASFQKLRGDIALFNRWPVPMPHWRHPDFVNEGNSDDEDDDLADKLGDMILFHWQYTYKRGIRYEHLVSIEVSEV